MSVRRIRLISFMILFYLVLSVNCSAEGEIIFEADSIELVDGYLITTDGFDLWIDGNYLTGQEVYLDITKGEYHLHEVGFTTCKLEHPHYQIYAKRINLFLEDKLILSGAKIQLGEGLTIPIPFRLVLDYREGRYQFSDWIPRLVYSSDDGLGMEFNGSTTFSDRFNLAGKLLVMFKGVGELDIEAKYLPSDLVLTSNIAYNKDWSSKMDLDWRKGKEGFGGEINWSFEEGVDEKNLVMNYLYKGYQSRLGFDLVEDQPEELSLKVNSPLYNWGIIDYQIGLDYIDDLTENRDYTRSYLRSIFSDQYRWNSTQFGWSLKPTQYLVFDYGQGGKLHADLWFKTPLTDELDLHLAYKKTNRWGTISDDLIDYITEEYTVARINYHQRNTLDEGWSWELAGKYDLDQQKFAEATTKIVRAYDCFDVEVKVDILEEIFDLGIRLKY